MVIILGPTTQRTPTTTKQQTTTTKQDCAYLEDEDTCKLVREELCKEDRFKKMCPNKCNACPDAISDCFDKDEDMCKLVGDENCKKEIYKKMCPKTCDACTDVISGSVNIYKGDCR